jgi:hypothetical protein
VSVILKGTKIQTAKSQPEKMIHNEKIKSISDTDCVGPSSMLLTFFVFLPVQIITYFSPHFQIVPKPVAF